MKTRRSLLLAVAAMMGVSSPLMGTIGTRAAAAVNPLVVSVEPAMGKVGDDVWIRYHFMVGGFFQTGDVTQEFKAPVGAELVGLSNYPSTGAPYPFPYVCKWSHPKTDVSCVNQGGWGFGGLADMGSYLVVRIVAPITAPGLIKVTCITTHCALVRSAPIVLNGVSATKPTPKPTSPAPTKNQTPSSASPSATSPTATPLTGAATASVEAVGLEPTAAAPGSVLANTARRVDDSWLFASGGGAVMVVGVVAFLVLARRRKRAGDDGEP